MKDRRRLRCPLESEYTNYRRKKHSRKEEPSNSTAHVLLIRVLVLVLSLVPVITIFSTILIRHRTSSRRTPLHLHYTVSFVCGERWVGRRVCAKKCEVQGLGSRCLCYRVQVRWAMENQREALVRCYRDGTISRVVSGKQVELTRKRRIFRFERQSLGYRNDGHYSL